MYTVYKASAVSTCWLHSMSQQLGLKIALCLIANPPPGVVATTISCATERCDLRHFMNCGRKNAGHALHICDAAAAAAAARQLFELSGWLLSVAHVAFPLGIELRPRVAGDAPHYSTLPVVSMSLCP